MSRISKYTPRGFKLRVRRAASGRGLFTEEKIPKGACIIEYTGRPATFEEMVLDDGKYLFWSGKMTMINGNIPANKARFINHACKPNCDADGPEGRIFIFARKNIKAGEELTYDYGEEYFDKHIKPHGCRCTQCAGKQ